METRTRRQPEIDWIFFDIGGVLLDESEPERRRIDLIVSVLRRYVTDVSSADVVAKRAQASAMIGSLNDNLVSLMLAADADKAAATDEIRRRWPEVQYEETSVVRPEAAAVLVELSRSYRLGLMANQPGRVKGKLAEAGLMKYFTHQGVSGEYGFHKPDPRLFEEVFRETGADSRRSAMIDDNIERGLAPAGRFGMKTVWYASGNHEADLEDHRISSLTDLLAIF